MQKKKVNPAAVRRLVFQVVLTMYRLRNNSINYKYVRKIIKKHTGNDFMNIEKTKDHYKKALDINLKTIITQEVWENLVDVVNLRNMMIHNNGRIDEQFNGTTTYTRLKGNVYDKIFRLEKSDVLVFFKSIMELTTEVLSLYYKEYLKYSNIVIANYYFNLKKNI